MEAEGVSDRTLSEVALTDRGLKGGLTTFPPLRMAVFFLGG